VHYSYPTLTVDGEPDFSSHTVEVTFDKVARAIEGIYPDACLFRVEVFEITINDDLRHWLSLFHFGQQLLPLRVLSLKLIPVAPFERGVADTGPSELVFRHLRLIFHVILGVFLASDCEARVKFGEAVLDGPLDTEVRLGHSRHVTLLQLYLVGAGVHQLSHDLS